MARLIDVNKVIDSMQECLDEPIDEKHSVAYFAFEKIIECLKQEPTVDAVEVVRCKDCKYFKTPLCENEDNHDDWFCADGERKDGDGNGKTD